MSSHGQWTPGDLVSTEPVVVGYDVTRELGRLRTEALAVMGAIPTGDLTPRVAADFAARCDQVARAVLRLERAQHQPDVIDEQLRDAAVAAQATAVDAPRPVREQFSANGKGWPPP